MTKPHAPLTVTATDGMGRFDAYVSYPDTDAPAGAIVVIQEIFGVNRVMRDICDGLARAGYIAVCPDLFWRQQPGIQLTDQTEAEWKRAFALYQGFDVDLGVEDLKATLAAARTLEGCSGRAGTIGYCLGGRLAFLMATRSDADCNVSYYGVALDEHLGEIDRIQKPLLMHVAALDKFVPAEARAKIVAALSPRPGVELHVYEGADHAFARQGGEHYDADAAKTANDRTAAFLARHLAG
jgi:carboxymethylenebutenolidase